MNGEPLISVIVSAGPARERAIHLEGGLFGPDLLERLEAGALPGQRWEDFKPAAAKGAAPRSLVEEIAEVYRDARDLWRVFQRRLERLPDDDPATSLTREGWIIPFLGLLGYELRYNPRAYQVGEVSYALSHRAGENEDAPPVHIVGARQALGRVDPRARPRLSPHALVQEFLNRSDHLWGLVTNGRMLRLLRKSSLLRRQAYVEFDLAALFQAEGDAHFGDFVLLYRLLHRTRLPQGTADAPTCWLEYYHQEALQQGNRARDRLRAGVEEALKILAEGFLRANPALPYEAPNQASALYADLLHLVYRLLFLLVAEERQLLGGDDLYREHYSVSRLRRLVDRREAYTDHEDLWHSLRVLWHLLRDASPQADGQPLASLLGLSVLDGALFDSIPLDNLTLSNKDLLHAFFHLAYYYDEEAKTYRRVNYAALDVEELGSVYESLLDNHPQITEGPGGPTFRFTAGTQRKTTGSYYTPPELVQELIKSALEPVLQERLRQVSDPAKQQEALLSIRVLDPACGSGHFLLAAARRLAKELARLQTGEDEPSPEAQREAVRTVIAHCIYGVDKNPLAVELCKVALWIESHLPGKPLTFLDHRIRCGDSLVGVTLLQVLQEGLPDEAFEPVAGDDKATARTLKQRNAAQRSGQLELFDPVLVTPSPQSVLEMQALAAIRDDTVEGIAEKARRYRALRDSLRRLYQACNLWTAAFFQQVGRGSQGVEQAITTEGVWRALAGQPLPRQVVAQAEALARQLHFFHWPLEFLDVFAEGGFDVVLGNPPFMGGLKIGGALGWPYRRWLEYAYAPFKGTADLCAAFYRRAFSLLKPGGRLGMVATNTIGQGDTRESGLAVILQAGGTITFARRFIKWPGVANVEVNLVAVRKKLSERPPAQSPTHTAKATDLSEAPQRALLDGRPVPFISSRLDDQPEAEPKRLPPNEGKAFQGDIVRGIGFVLEPAEAEALLAKNPRYADCLFPYLNGEDLNSHPEQKPSRWVICFHDWPLERARQYPDLLHIVEKRVKPERERLRGPGDKRNREYWWQFGAYRTGMRQAIAPLRRVLVRALTSEMHLMTFVPKGWIYSHAVGVFAFDDDYHFALLQSVVHEVWVWRQASSLGSSNRYTPTDCFDTFPFPLEEYRRMVGGGWCVEALPEPFQRAAQVGAAYHEHRRQVMLRRQLGLTKTYNLFHDPTCQEEDIQRLRALHAEMDRAVLACYGWDDLDLQHDFYRNDRGQARFMPSDTARRELLFRLMALNEELSKKGN